jgi:hypothetical protein
MLDCDNPEQVVPGMFTKTKKDEMSTERFYPGGAE